MLIRKLTLAGFLMTLTVSAHAQFVAGIGYFNVSVEEADLGIIGGTIGYEFPTAAENFTLIPEVRVAVGVQDESINVAGTSVDVEIDSAYGVGLRGQYDFNNGAYVFLEPTYMNYEVQASAFGLTASEDDWEFGAALGIGISMSPTSSIELSFESVDDADILGVAFRLNF